MFYRAVWRPGGGEDQRALETHDKDEAMKLGRLLLAELLRGEVCASTAPLTLGTLWRRYSSECAEYLDNKERSRKGSEASARVLIGYFGDGFLVEDLSKDRQRAFERSRMAGGIATLKGATRPTRARSAEFDVALLHAMLLWATTVKTGPNTYLLRRNPLAGVRRIREKNKKQPVATWERYDATVAAMRELSAREKHEAGRMRWVRMEFALFLAERTGRRLGSIRSLRWEDFQPERGVVYWRADADKKGYKWEVPMPTAFFDEVRHFQRQLGAAGGPVFPADTRDGVTDRHLFDKWLSIAETHAKLPKLDGGLWHAYRRKWAIERKHLPLKDVAAAGGWKDVNTLLEIYQQPDDAGVLAVMSETRKLRERGVA
jgi:integrase